MIPKEARDEQLISMVGMLCFHQWGALMFRTKKIKVRFECILELFFEKLVAAEYLGQCLATNIPIDLASNCSEFDGQTCCHMRNVTQMTRMRDRAPQQKLNVVWKSLHLVVQDCATAVHIACDMVKDLAKNMSEMIPKAAFTEDASKLTAVTMQARSKKRRIDEDFKNHVVATMVQSGRSRNTRACLRSAAVCSDKIALVWEHKRMLKYQSEGWSMCENGIRAISVAIDGKRIGQPAEETETYACWVWPQNKSLWLPIQEFIIVSLLNWHPLPPPSPIQYWSTKIEQNRPFDSQDDT